MNNLTRTCLLMKFLDLVFGNRSVSIGKDGKLNNIDNRFDKCTFTIPYRDMLLKILEIIIFEPTVVIKNRNTKRNGEYTEISHDEIMKRLSDFISWMFRIDIYYYYSCISKIEDIPVKQEDLIFEILSNVMQKEVFNPSKIETKSTGYGYINIESLEIHLKNFLKKRFNDKWIYKKIVYYITTYLVDHIDFEAKVGVVPCLKYEIFEKSSISELLNQLTSDNHIGDSDLIIRYLLNNKEKLLDISDHVIVKTYWRTIECFKSNIHQWQKYQTNKIYYFQEFLFMLEDIIKSLNSNYFNDTFKLYVKAYSNRLTAYANWEIRKNLEKEEDFYNNEWE